MGSSMELAKSMLDIQSETSAGMNTPLHSMMQMYDYFEKMKHMDQAKAELYNGFEYFGQFDEPFLLKISKSDEMANTVRIQRLF
jgi:hypothetical protein